MLPPCETAEQIGGWGLEEPTRQQDPMWSNQPSCVVIVNAWLFHVEVFLSETVFAHTVRARLGPYVQGRAVLLSIRIFLFCFLRQKVLRARGCA